MLHKKEEEVKLHKQEHKQQVAIKQEHKQQVAIKQEHKQQVVMLLLAVQLEEEKEEQDPQ
jgi:hypothetical protein